MYKSKKYNKVFISYASEDIETANMLYEYLITHNFEPWLDKKNLLIGQEWDSEIKNALKKSDFIIILLSHISVEKRGYVQKEYKLAAEFVEEKLDSDIYIIPCKINDCDVPNNLRKYQWLELYKQIEDIFAPILKSLHFQQQKYRNSDQIITTANQPFKYEEKEIKDVINEILPQTTINITYPQFINTENIDFKMLNSFIENIIFPAYNGFRIMSYSDIFGNEDVNVVGKEDGFNSGNEIEMTYKFHLLSDSMISFEIWQYTYYSGAAHPNIYIRGYSFILNPLKEINNIKKLFDQNDGALEKLHSICLEKLRQEAIERELISNGNEDFLLCYPKEWQTFYNFHFTKESMVFIFNPYEISCYAHGHLFAEIIFSEISTLFSDIKNITIIMKLIEENDFKTTTWQT